ncbi:MAG: PEP-CTERM sorting domain-containing protein [Phycisphaerae bacterium]
MTDIDLVPEPTTGLLLGAGLVGAVVRKKNRRSALAERQDS